MPPRVRRAPLLQRIKSNLDPWDWLLWISEELNTNDWEEFAEAWATTVGIALNVVFMIARSWAGETTPSSNDDVFGDYEGKSGTGWLPWFFASLVVSLSFLSVANAAYAFFRTKSYRLFERSVETSVSTPSARRVRVDSAPLSSSPMQRLSSAFTASSAQSRSHPNTGRDVWEILVWDPTPICLRLFCLFSPGHVIVYWLFLPTAKFDPQPSVTVVKTIFLTALLSLQLHFLRHNFVQQNLDNKIVQGEVMHEYDTKFVHPALNRPVRDVGIQMPPPDHREKYAVTANEVDVYTPTTVLKRGFHPNPNPAYASQYDPDNLRSPPPQPKFNPVQRSTATFTPSSSAYNTYAPNSVATNTDYSSPSKTRHATPQRAPIPQPRFHQSDVGAGDGGSLGIYSHVASPLRKTASSNHLRLDEGERVREPSPVKRLGSPLKRMSTPSGRDRSSGLERIPGPNFAHQRLSGYGGPGVNRRETGRY